MSFLIAQPDSLQLHYHEMYVYTSWTSVIHVGMYEFKVEMVKYTIFNIM